VQAVVAAFQPHHQSSGYASNFFGVSLAHATAFAPGSHIYKVLRQDPKTFVPQETGPFVVQHVTPELRYPPPHGPLTGMKYVYLTTHLRDAALARRSRVFLRVGDRIRVARPT